MPTVTDTATPPPGPGRGPVVGLVAAAIVGCLLLSRGMPLFWFGGAVLAAVWVTARQRYGTLLSRGWAARGREPVALLARLGYAGTGRQAQLEALYLLALVVVASLMMADLIGGERPVSHDHTVHYFKAWQLHRDFLAEGRLHGWSHRWFAGYPANYLYPIGADLWVNLVHALGFGLLSFSRAYGVAFYLFHAFTGLAGYRFGRMVGGPHVGFVTGLLLLTDMGAFRLGGWAYTVEFGVWPQALSLCFGLLALCQLPGMARGQTPAPIARFGLYMGLAILTHPVQLIFIALLVPVVVLGASLATDAQVMPLLARLLGAIVLSLGVSSVWLLPFFDTRSETNAMGVWWDSTYEMGLGLLDLTTLPGTLGYVMAFGVLALLVGLRTRRFVPLTCALLSLFIPVVCSSTFVDEFRLPQLSAAFGKVQYLRMATMVKPFWFALAGSLVVAVSRQLPGLVDQFEGLPDAARPHDRQASSAGGATPWLTAPARAFVVALLVLPLATPAVLGFWTEHVMKSLRTVEDRQFLRDRTELGDWLRRNLPDDGFYRVGIFMGHNHDLFDLATEFDRPIYKRGFTPCSNYRFKMNTREPAVLDAVKLRYAISKRSLPTDEFERVARFGIYSVYRYLRYTPGPLTVLGGDARIHMRRFDAQEIAFDVDEGASGQVRLPVSWFPRFAAYRDGAPVPITLTHLPEAPDKTGFITLPLQREGGRYRVVFEPSWLDRLAFPLSLGALALCLVLVWRGRFPAWTGEARWRQAAESLSVRLSAWRARYGAACLLFLAGLVLVAAVVVTEWTPPVVVGAPESGQRIEAVRYDFLESVADARARIRYGASRRRCSTVFDRLVCPDRDGNLSSDRYVGSSPTTIEEYRMVRCLRARPEQGGALSLYFPRVPVGDALVGYFGNDFEGRLLNHKRPVEFSIDVNGTRVLSTATEQDNHMHPFFVPLRAQPGPMRVAFNVRADNARKRWFCFHAQVVDVSPSN